MLYAKNTAMVLAVMFFVLAINASAQWSPGGSMVYMGDLNLAASSVSSEKAVQALGGSQDIQAATNNSSLNNSSINGTSMDNSAIINSDVLPTVGLAKSSTQASNAAAVNPAAVPPSADNAVPPGKGILDLSGYSRDRTNKNLAGYTNIMYPISGSRGSTTSTAGGGGSCGCG